MRKEMKILAALFVLITGTIFIGCEESSQPEEQKIPYMVLNVGDIREAVYFDGNDTIMVEKMNFVGKIKRTDGLELFKNANGIDTSYYYLSNEYFIASDKNKNIDTGYFKVNPYREQKLACLYPSEGISWQAILGDTSSLKFKAYYVGEKQTPCGVFKDVYVLKTSVLDIYYAPKVGWIGSKYAGATKEILATYIKVGGVEYGKPSTKKLSKRNILDVGNKNIYYMLGLRK